MRDIQKYSFKSAVSEWSKPPVDEVGYLASSSLLKMSDAALKPLIEQATSNRYDLNGWRNWHNLWRHLLCLDITWGKRILDFGCGIGIEALEFAKAGNEVLLYDIVPNNVALAQRVLTLFGCGAAGVGLATEEPPYFEVLQPVDIFYSNGVMHHTPQFREILLRAVEVLAPGGEIRLMLYSDKGWQWGTGSDVPPANMDIQTHPDFNKFVSAFDGVGYYANWFNREKIELLVGDFLDIIEWSYLGEQSRYSATILKPKGAK